MNLLPGRLQIEYCERCCYTQLKEIFHQVGLEEFYKTYLDKDKYSAFYKVNGFAIWKHLCGIRPEFTLDRQRLRESVKGTELLYKYG